MATQKIQLPANVWTKVTTSSSSGSIYLSKGFDTVSLTYANSEPSTNSTTIATTLSKQNNDALATYYYNTNLASSEIWARANLNDAEISVTPEGGSL